VPTYKTMVKLSAPRGMAGMLGRQTFDIPDTLAGAKFMGWWEKAAEDKRVEVLQYAQDNQLGVVDALEKVQCGQ